MNLRQSSGVHSCCIFLEEKRFQKLILKLRLLKNLEGLFIIFICITDELKIFRVKKRSNFKNIFLKIISLKFHTYRFPIYLNIIIYHIIYLLLNSLNE